MTECGCCNPDIPLSRFNVCSEHAYEPGKSKLIISLCDFSGNWPFYYKQNGYEVILVDVVNDSDVRQYRPPYQPYGVLSAPPCTVYANSGARRNNTPHRSDWLMADAHSIVKACYDISLLAYKFWAMENPRGTIQKFNPYIGPPKLSFWPSQYAGFAPNPESEAYTKDTYIYGDFNPDLKIKPMPICKEGYIHRMTKDARKTIGSITPLGFAFSFYQANP